MIELRIRGNTLLLVREDGYQSPMFVVSEQGLDFSASSLNVEFSASGMIHMTVPLEEPSAISMGSVADARSLEETSYTWYMQGHAEEKQT